jgi:uncharacterized protein
MPTNALIREKSPYLLQHAHNPVNWLPWGEEAFARSRAEQKPIFLSVGYSTCHWCHVMERESFESPDVAEILNRDFISIKVDREERPDVDRVYMYFVQAFSGSGGWPMSVWLTPELKPFYGGTYFPRDSSYGRPGFPSLLRQLASAWQTKRDDIERSSVEILDRLKSDTPEAGAVRAGESGIDRKTIDLGFEHLRRSFDTRWGGFGTAPKFPRPVSLRFLLGYHVLAGSSEALEMTTETLRAMAAGGMHDHLGGGFHRYSVDAYWFVPHFEKMLYDQGQLAVAYLEAFQVTRDPALATIACDILDYVLRDMTSPEGGFYSAEDADSSEANSSEHKAEGAFYVWRAAEIEQLLDRQSAALFEHRHGVRADGNVDEDPHQEFGGKNILFEAFTLEGTAQEYRLGSGAAERTLDAAKKTLFAARENRPRPLRDDKILTAWNGLMISAFARGYAVLGEVRYLNAARRAMDCILTRLVTSEGQLLRRLREGDAAIRGFLDDYGLLLNATLDLFEVEPASRYLAFAKKLAHDMADFEDTAEGGFFSTRKDDPNIVLRIKEEYDGAEPSGNSSAIEGLARLTQIIGEPSYVARAMKGLAFLGPRVNKQPTVAPYLLLAAMRLSQPPEHVILRYENSNPEVNALIQKQRDSFRPFTPVLALTDSQAAALEPHAPFLAGLPRQGTLTMYRCSNFACQLPEVLA